MNLLNINDFDEVYALFQKAFIPAELRPYQKTKRLVKDKELMIYGLKQNNKIVVALLVWKLNGFVFLENFAVDESLRGQGIGGQFLDDFKQLFPNQTLILEVEKPYDEMSHRRIGFYQRHQMVLNPFSYEQPTLDVKPTNVILQLMTSPNAINEKQFQIIKKEIFKTVYKQKIEE